MAHSPPDAAGGVAALGDTSATDPPPAPAGLLGQSAYQWKAGIAAWLGWMFDGLDMQLYTLVAAPFVAQLLQVANTNDPAVKLKSSIIQGAFLFGWALGGGLFGRLGDKLGRSRALGLTILTYAAFTGLSFVAQTWWQLMIFRFLAALGIGGEWAVGSSLLSETWPAHLSRLGGGGPADRREYWRVGGVRSRVRPGRSQPLCLFGRRAAGTHGFLDSQGGARARRMAAGQGGSRGLAVGGGCRPGFCAGKRCRASGSKTSGAGRRRFVPRRHSPHDFPDHRRVRLLADRLVGVHVLVSPALAQPQRTPKLVGSRTRPAGLRIILRDDRLVDCRELLRRFRRAAGGVSQSHLADVPWASLRPYSASIARSGAI